jgi:hypothetical protein
MLSSEISAPNRLRLLLEIAIPFVMAVLPAAGQPLSAFGLRSLTCSAVFSSELANGCEKVPIKFCEES